MKHLLIIFSVLLCSSKALLDACPSQNYIKNWGSDVDNIFALLKRRAMSYNLEDIPLQKICLEMLQKGLDEGAQPMICKELAVK